MIWLDDVECDGNETTILNCAANDPLGSHNCRHSQDAGASCQEGRKSGLLNFEHLKLLLDVLGHGYSVSYQFKPLSYPGPAFSR